MASILRELTTEEKKEIRPLEPNAVLKKFGNELAQREQKAVKSYKPFDSYGARIDFENYLKTKASNIMSTVDPNKVDNSLDFDLEPYSEMSRFEYKGAEEYKVPSKIMGVQQDMLVGKSYKFITKVRGNKFGIFVPLDDVEKYEKWLEKVFTEDVKNIINKTAAVEEDFKREVESVKEVSVKTSSK